MALLGRKLAVSVPDTVLEDKEAPRERTAKLGIMARACAIYGVDVIEVFKDPTGPGEGQTIRKVLEYLETPQYLRRKLYPIDEALKYAGMLPPLRIPSHKPRMPMEKIAVGEVREGVVNSDGTVDIGLEFAPNLDGKVPPGRRVTVRVSSLKPPLVRVISRTDVGGYWGYTVETKSLDEVLSDMRFPLKIATSRLGGPMAEELGRMGTAVRKAAGVKLIFGSPSRGLFGMVSRDLPNRTDFVVNLFPEQQVETVRTEEAISAGLALVAMLSVEKA